MSFRFAAVLQTPKDEHSAVYIAYRALAEHLVAAGSSLDIVTPDDLNFQPRYRPAGSAPLPVRRPTLDAIASGRLRCRSLSQLRGLAGARCPQRRRSSRRRLLSWPRAAVSPGSEPRRSRDRTLEPALSVSSGTLDAVLPEDVLPLRVACVLSEQRGARLAGLVRLGSAGSDNRDTARRSRRLLFRIEVLSGRADDAVRGAVVAYERGSVSRRRCDRADAAGSRADAGVCRHPCKPADGPVRLRRPRPKPRSCDSENRSRGLDSTLLGG